MPNRSISNLNPCCMVRSSISFSNMKKILVSLNHPAHYHLFKNTVAILRQRGYEPLYVISNKDILERLMIAENVEYTHWKTEKYSNLVL